MQSETKRYTDQADLFLQQAVEEMERGDLRQAAEKGWGAAAQTVKALAESRGWEHHAHRHLSEAVSRLAVGADNYPLLRGYASAQALHTSFYEGGLSTEAIIDNISKRGLQFG